MIYYLDTSALLKIFMPEDESGIVAAWLAETDKILTSRVTHAEVCAGLARRHHQGRITKEQFASACLALDQQWQVFRAVEVDELAAGKLAIKHVIRGFDSVQLAAALEARAKAGEDSVVFCSFDKRQAAAAQAEKLSVLPA